MLLFIILFSFIKYTSLIIQNSLVIKMHLITIIIMFTFTLYLDETKLGIFKLTTKNV